MNPKIKHLIIIIFPIIAIASCNSGGAGSGLPSPSGGGSTTESGVISFSESTLELDSGNSSSVNLNLNGSSGVSSLVVNLQSSNTSIATVSPNICNLSSSSSSCSVSIMAESQQGTVSITATPTNNNYSSQTLVATVNLNGWIPTDSTPPTVDGQANAVGFASDQLGNLYLSYQGDTQLTVYRYLFGQTNPTWTVLAESQNMSLSAYNSSIAVSAINVLNLTYLYTPDPTEYGEIHYLSALPDKINFTNISIPRVLQPYEPKDSGCPAGIDHQLMASEAVMTLDSADKQVIAYSDELIFQAQSTKISDTVTCTAQKYNGGSKLGMYFASDYSTHRQLSDGTATQIAITATPVGSFEKAYPLFVAYKDGANNSGISVQKITLDNTESPTFTYLGSKNFSNGAVNFVSVAADSNGTPYVAYQNKNQTLTVKKFDGLDWVDVGTNPVSSTISRWISLTVNPKTNIPYIAYQENNKIKIIAFVNGVWSTVGSAIDIPSNIPATYTNLIMRQESLNNWQPTVAFQATPQGSESSNISTYYYKEKTESIKNSLVASPLQKLLNYLDD